MMKELYCLYKVLKLIFKTYFNLPIYRVDILMAARWLRHDTTSLCFCISSAMTLAHVRYKDAKCFVFPLFGTNVSAFNGDTNQQFWWEIDVWDTGRLAYLDWLIEQYKDDKTDLNII